MIGGIDYGYFRTYLFYTVDEFSALAGVNVLAGKRGEKPCGAFEKVGVGELYSGVFFACHGMTGEESVSGVASEGFCGALDNLRFGAADVGYQCLRRQRWT